MEFDIPNLKLIYIWISKPAFRSSFRQSKLFEFVKICGKKWYLMLVLKVSGKLNKNVMSLLIYPNYFGVVGY